MTRTHIAANFFLFKTFQNIPHTTLTSNEDKIMLKTPLRFKKPMAMYLITRKKNQLYVIQDEGLAKTQICMASHTCKIWTQNNRLSLKGKKLS